MNMQFTKTTTEHPEKNKTVLGYWGNDQAELCVFTDIDGDDYWYFKQDGEPCDAPKYWMYWDNICPK